MKVIAKESGLTEIKTAIYYKSPVMPYGIEDLYTQLDPNRNYTMTGREVNVISQGVYYNSGELGCDFRFFEYGLKYFFESGNPLESFGKDFEELLTKDGDKFLGPRELGDIGKYIIPTNLPQGLAPGKLKYFGKFRTSSQEVYAFYVPEGISKIELYDEVLDPTGTYYDYDYGWQQISKPGISIYLGVTSDGKVPRAWKDTDMILGPTPETDLDSLGSLQDERDCSKMVFIVLEQKSRYGGIDISVTAWTKLLEPLRNKPEAHLRTLSDLPEQTVETIPGLIFDGASGSILGRKLENPQMPILKKKQQRINSLDWNAFRRYRLGEEAVYSGETWVSLGNENFGNNPKMSPKWARKEEMTNFFSTWFNILCKDGKISLLGSGKETTRINVPRYVKESVFRLNPNLGYLPASPEVIKSSNPDINLDVIYTENFDLNELRYYMFYLIWSEDSKPEPGATIILPMEKRKIQPKLYVPYFLASPSSSDTWFDYSNTKEVDLSEVRGQYFTIDEEFKMPVGTAIRSIGDTLSYNTLAYNLQRLKFYVDKKSDQGESTFDLESIWDPETGDVSIFLEDKVDYEECSYYLKVSWDYRKIIISNSGDYAIESPVSDVIRTENFSTKIKPILPDTTPKTLRVKYRGEWINDIPFDGRSATWTSGNRENIITLSVSSDPEFEGYILRVSNVTEDLVIDIKVV